MKMDAAYRQLILDHYTQAGPAGLSAEGIAEAVCEASEFSNVVPEGGDRALALARVGTRALSGQDGQGLAGAAEAAEVARLAAAAGEVAGLAARRSYHKVPPGRRVSSRSRAHAEELR